MFLTRKILIAPALLTALALLQPACTSGDKQGEADAEDNLAVNENAGLEGDNQSGNATTVKNNGEQSENFANENGNTNAEEQKTPISEDGYDDDWNNLNSQQQKANTNKNNKKNQIANEEPPLENEGFGQQQQQQAPVEQVVEQPAQQYFEQVPAEEPPLDLEPAPVAEVPALEPASVPAPVISVAPVVSGAPLIKQDAEPVFAKIHWVGYDYLEKDSVVRIEIVTRGSPRYNLFQERNKSDQPELVLRFFNTQLRHKVRRDIDASEFRSPVAYVRMRPDEVENSVDVIITLRDGVKPRMFSKFGNILLTFPIPDHYFGNAAIGSAPIAKAEVLANANVMPDLDEESEIPEGLRIAKAFVNNPGNDALGQIPNDAGEPVETESLPVSYGTSDNTNVLPDDFNTGNQNPVQSINNFGGIDNVGGNNNAVNNNFANSQDYDEGNFENTNNGGGNQENGEFSDFQGEPEQGAEDFDFGGGQAQGTPAQGGNNFSDSELNGDASGDEGQQEGTGDELDEDSLNEFEDEGGGQEEINKFDVRLNSPADPLALFAGFIVSQVSINAVAQDDFNEEFEQDQSNSAQGNSENSNQGGNPELGNVAAQGDIENSSLGGQNNGNAGGNSNFNGGGNTNAGEGNFGNNGGNNFGEDDDFLNDGNTGGNNFGNTGDAGGNNFGNNGGNAFPENNSGNVPNTTLNSGNNSNAGGTFNTMNTGNAINYGAGTNLAPDTVNEPGMEGSPDLTGPETEGSDTETADAPSAGGRKVKLDFRGAPLRDVIRVLSDESGVNFVFAASVGNTPIFINLIDIPFNDALKALLSTNGLGMYEIGPGIVKIDTLTAIVDEKKKLEENRKTELHSQPTKILVHRMSYARALGASTLILPMLQAASKGDPRVSTQSDLRTNSVIINAVPEVLSVAKALLERIDMETPQVKIASRIVEVVKTIGDRMGVSWGTPFNFDQGRGLGFGNLVFPNYMMSRYTVDAGGAAPAAGNAQFRLGSLNNSMALDLALSMEEAKGTTEILQSNDITVEDNTPATITAGRTDFFPPVVSNGTVAPAERIEYNLTMTVTPHISSDGSVQMQLSITTSEPGPAAAAGARAASNTKAINTSLLRRSGETAVIGGVYNSNISKLETGVPFFSSIPIIGALFRTRTHSDTKRELLIMVTPTIMSSIGKGFASGDEPASFSANASGSDNANFNTQLNNSENFNSNNQSDGNFESNGNFSNNNNGQQSNNNSGSNNPSNNQNQGNGNIQNQGNGNIQNQSDDEE